MHEITVLLTDEEKLCLEGAAAAMGKTPGQLVADELRHRHGLPNVSGYVVELRRRRDGVK